MAFAGHRVLMYVAFLATVKSSSMILAQCYKSWALVKPQGSSPGIVTAGVT